VAEFVQIPPTSVVLKLIPTETLTPDNSSTAILESAHDAVIAHLLDGTVTFWNPAAERMFGYGATEAVGGSIRRIIPPELLAEEDFLLARIVRGESLPDFRTICVGKDGHQVSVSLTVSPIRNAQGTICGASRIARDVTTRTHTDAVLAAIVASSDDAIVSKTLDGIITSWSAGAERMFGYTAAEAIGRSVRMIIPPERQAEEDYVLGQIRRGEKVDHFETERVTKDGRRLNISLTVSPMRNEAGTIIGASKIARDITERKQWEHEREVALQRMAQAVASRDEFIATAAHELRNPLNVLTLLWRVLDHNNALAGTPQGNLVEKARVQLARLTSLVDRLLDITRIRAGAFELYREEFELGELIREVANRFVIESPKIPIIVEADVAIVGHWDRLRVDQVVTNLLSNAIKYGEGKPISVAISCEADTAVVVVSDQGKGIAPDNLGRIFDRFERVDSATDEIDKKSHEGLGLGLWITRRIVEAHGGTIFAESEVGRGSRFVVRLPHKSA